jgi:pimeloyl-ACP methyl ester carboxylesterase
MSFAHPPVTTRSPRARLASATRLLTLRTRFGVLDRVAPRRGAALAMRVWCSLPGNAGRRRDLRTSAGEVVRVRAPQGREVVAETWGEGPTVYLVHGWGGWRGQLGAFVDPLVATGHRVVAFDAPSHGDSDPGAMGAGSGNLLELIEAFTAVADRFGPAEAVVAHSLGCTSASWVVHSGLETQRLVLIAPNHDFVEITYDFAALLGFGERTRTLLQQDMEDFCGRPLADFDLVPLGADGTMPDTLVVHDRRDKETPYEVGARVAEAWPTATLRTTEGLGHQRILADPDVVAAVVAHVGEAVRTA